MHIHAAAFGQWMAIPHMHQLCLLEGLQTTFSAVPQLGAQCGRCQSKNQHEHNMISWNMYPSKCKSQQKMHTGSKKTLASTVRIIPTMPAIPEIPNDWLKVSQVSQQMKEGIPLESHPL